MREPKLVLVIICMWFCDSEKVFFVGGKGGENEEGVDDVFSRSTCA